MNAEAAKHAGRLGTKEFYEFVENFEAKLNGRKISAEDVRAFYEVISAPKDIKNKNISGSVTQIEPSIADKTSKLLHQIQNTLHKNKDVIESASKGVPYQHIEKALDSLTLYVEELKKKSKSITRKDADTMSRNQSQN